MIVKNPTTETKIHYKMFKDGKHWAYAGITTLMFSTAILGAGTIAHADTATTPDSTSGSSTEQVTGSNAVTVSTPASDTASKLTSSSTDTGSMSTPTSTVNSANSDASATTNSNSTAASSATSTAPTASSSAVSSANDTTSKAANQNSTSTDAALTATANTTSATTTNLGTANSNAITVAQSSANAVYESTGTPQVITAVDPLTTAQVDSSSLTSEASNASSIGANITQTATQTVTAATLPEAQAKVKASYEAQAASLSIVQAAQQADNTQFQDAVADYNKKFTQYQTDMAAYTKAKTAVETTNAANEAAFEQATAQYNEDYATYQTKMADYEVKLNGADAATTLSDSQIIQGLILDKEPNAKATVTTNGQEASSYVASASNSADTQGFGNGVDSPTIYDYSFNGSQTGTVATVTYTGLTNSTYTDPDGTIHKIGKIVRTFSDLTIKSNALSSADPNNIDATTGNKLWTEQQWGKPVLAIYSDPTDGWWYYNAEGVTVTDQLFDENGNPIDMTDKTAYVSVSSLNAVYQDGDDVKGWKNSQGQTVYTNKAPALSGVANHVEEVKAVDSNTQGYQLAGSSIKLHSDGSLYADATNNAPYAKPSSDQLGANDNNAFYVEADKTTATSDIYDWDGTGSAHQYFGSAVFKVKGNSYSLRFSVNNSKSDWNGSVWATISTTIPTTPVEGPTPPTRPTPPTPVASSVKKPTEPEKPTASTETGSYHLETISVTPQKVTKVAINEGKTLLAGDTQTSTVSEDTGVGQSYDQFAIGDFYYYVTRADGTKVSPVSVTKSNVTVTDSNGDDVTDQFDLSIIGDTKLNGDEVYEVLATFKDPSNIPENTTYHLTPKANILEDQSTNDEVDTGFSLINGEITTTNNHNYPEAELDPTKDVVATAKSGGSLQDQESIDNESFAIGTTIDYKLNSSVRPANYGGETTEWGLHDTFDSTHDQYNGVWHAYADEDIALDNGTTITTGTDISNYFTETYDKSTGTFNVQATQDLLNLINSNTNKDTKQAYTVYAEVTRIAAGTNIANTVDETYNHQGTDSNTVHTTTPNDPTPTKSVSNEDGTNIDNGNVEGGDLLDYEVDWDLTGYQDLAFSTVDIAKGVNIYDNYDETRVNPIEEDFTVTDEDGNAVKGVTVAWDDENGAFTVTADDPVSFIKAYAGQDLHVNFWAQVRNTDGDIVNTAIQNTFGQNIDTNTVTNHVDHNNPTKEVVANTTDTTNIDGKTIVKGTKIYYELDSSDRTANYTGKTDQWSLSDTFDLAHDQYNDGDISVVAKDKITLADGTVINAGNDISKYFTETYDSATGKLTVAATQAYLDIMNLAANRVGTQGWTAFAGITRIASGTDIPNTVDESYNNVSTNSNTVHTTTPNDPDPTKTVTDEDGDNAENGNVVRGDKLDYVVSWDLTGFQDLAYSTVDLAKGVSIYDDYDQSKVTADTMNFDVVDADGNSIINDVNVAWDDDDGAFTVSAKDPEVFLDEYAGQKLAVHFWIEVNDTASDEVDNQATQDTFGNKVNTNIVKVNVPDASPTKEVVANTTATTNDDGKTMVIGTTFDYQLDSSIRTAGYVGKTDEWGITDTLDLTHDAYNDTTKIVTDYDFTDAKGNVVKAGSDISQYFDVSYDKSTGKLSVEATQDYLDLMDLQANKDTTQSWTAFAETNRIAAGTNIANTLDETYNNVGKNSNTVHTTTPNDPTPTKEVEDASGNNIENKALMRGDDVDYVINWDLTGLQKLAYDTVDLAKGVSIYDDYDESKVTANTMNFDVVDADGNSIINDVNVAWDNDNGAFTVSAKDPEAFLDKYAGQTLEVHFEAQINNGVTGELDNQATQDTFGNNVNTNVVSVKIPEASPTKDVVASIGNTTSLDGQNIEKGKTFTYTLASSVRPADYAGTTDQWSIVDTFDTAHDEYTGDWSVLADRDITMDDGTVVKAGTDISQYFTTNWNKDSGTITVSAKKDFLNTLNSDVNKATEQAWTFYPRLTRINDTDDGQGVTNTADEYYNNDLQKTNTVVTYTPKPKTETTTPNTPTTETPQVTPKTTNVSTTKSQPQAPQTAVAAPIATTPVQQQAQQAKLPQTGNASNNLELVGILGLFAAIGSFSFAGLFKRKVH